MRIEKTIYMYFQFQSNELFKKYIVDYMHHYEIDWTKFLHTAKNRGYSGVYKKGQLQVPIVAFMENATI